MWPPSPNQPTFFFSSQHSPEFSTNFPLSRVAFHPLNIQKLKNENSYVKIVIKNLQSFAKLLTKIRLIVTWRDNTHVDTIVYVNIGTDNITRIIDQIISNGCDWLWSNWRHFSPRHQRPPFFVAQFQLQLVLLFIFTFTFFFLSSINAHPLIAFGGEREKVSEKQRVRMKINLNTASWIHWMVLQLWLTQEKWME